jgi:hypothetical protein
MLCKRWRMRSHFMHRFYYDAVCALPTATSGDIHALRVLIPMKESVAVCPEVRRVQKCPAMEQGTYRVLQKGLQALREYSAHLNEKKSPSQYMSRNQCLPSYGRCSCDLCGWWFICISTQLSALCPTEVGTLSKIPGFTWISWQAFSPAEVYRRFEGTYYIHVQVRIVRHAS